MRGAFFIGTMIALLIGGAVYMKRVKAVPVAVNQAGLVGADGKPIKDLHELPKAVETHLNQLNEKTNDALKNTAE